MSDFTVKIFTSISFLLLVCLGIVWRHIPLQSAESPADFRSFLETVDTERQPNTRSSLHHQLCAVVPQVSPSFLWNTYFREPPAYVLRSGIRTRPKWSFWKQLLDSVERKMHQVENDNFRIGILISEQGMEENWRQELFSLGKMFHVNVQVLFYRKESELEQQEETDLDIVIDARRKRSDGSTLLHSSIVTTTIMTPNDENSLRAQKQSWIRRCLFQNRTLILLNPSLENGMWHETTYPRTLQLLADWYQIPFLSLATPTQSSDDAWNLSIKLVVFAALDFTMTFCHDAPPPPELSTLLKQGVQYRVERVVPPPLDVNLSLQDVSRLWKQVDDTD